MANGKAHKPSIPAYGDKPDVTNPQTSPGESWAWQGAVKNNDVDTSQALTNMTPPPAQQDAQFVTNVLKKRRAGMNMKTMQDRLSQRKGKK